LQVRFIPAPHANTTSLTRAPTSLCPPEILDAHDSLTDQRDRSQT
jgi:hypothetical protein